MYVTMLGSTLYANYKAADQAFTAKLLNNRVAFGTKSEWMTWINANISTNAFTNVPQFESMLDNVTNSLGAVVAANSTLFSYLRDADNEQHWQILRPEIDAITYPWDNVVPQNQCEEDCMDAAEAAIDANDQELVEARGRAADYGGLATIYYYWKAGKDHQNRFYQIALDFNACFGSC